MRPTPGAEAGLPSSQSVNPLSGRAECTAFTTLYEAFMVMCLAQEHKCHDQESNPHSAADNNRAWVRALERSTTTPYNGMWTLADHACSVSKGRKIVVQMHWTSNTN